MNWIWPHFTEAELRCNGTGETKIVPAFLTRLETLRVHYDKPMIVTSWYRAPEYNKLVSKTGLDGPHTTGRAIDIRVYGRDAHELVRLALRFGFTGIGLDQTGPPGSRFVHLDDLDNGPGCPRPWIWSYP